MIVDLPCCKDIMILVDMGAFIVDGRVEELSGYSTGYQLPVLNGEVVWQRSSRMGD
jgi:hypothetical protein